MRIKLLAKAFTVCAVLMAALPVLAMNLQEAMAQLAAAKTQGYLGEQPNGYLGVVSDKNNSGEVAKLINDARKSEYEALAKQNNILLKDVEAMAGKKAIEKTQTGNYIQADGKWVKKP